MRPTAASPLAPCLLALTFAVGACRDSGDLSGASSRDATIADGGALDAGLPGPGALDAGLPGPGALDAGLPGSDASSPGLDAGRLDGGLFDGGSADVGTNDPDTLFEGEASIAGLSTHVRLMGTTTSTRAPIILLHTGPELAHEYLPELMRFLVPGRFLVFYDLRGAGRTSFGTGAMTSSLTADRHALDLDDVVSWTLERAEGTPTRVDLLGHGYGAGIAALYAAARPDRVDHLVLTSPYPVTARQLAEYRAEAGSRLTSSERTLRNQILDQPECRGDVTRCTLEVWNIDGPHYLCDENRALFRSMRFQYGSDRVRDLIELDLTRQTYDWRPRLATVAAKTTVISGPCDPIPAAAPLAYTSSIAGAQHHVLDASGHFPMVEQRAEFQRIVLESLAR